jgi:hypothetical protein
LNDLIPKLKLAYDCSRSGFCYDEYYGFIGFPLYLLIRESYTRNKSQQIKAWEKWARNYKSFEKDFQSYGRFELHPFLYDVIVKAVEDGKKLK